MHPWLNLRGEKRIFLAYQLKTLQVYKSIMRSGGVEDCVLQDNCDY